MTTMLRVALALVYLALSGPAVAQVTGSIPPTTPSLKREATVSSDLVRIGDLIDNAGASARVPIFRAPDLGQSGMVSAARVVEAVRAHGFPIVETRGVAEIAVTRASRLITVKDLEARIANALAGQPGLGEAKNLVVTIERDARPIHLEPSVSAELQPSRLFYDPRAGRCGRARRAPPAAHRPGGAQRRPDEAGNRPAQRAGHARLRGAGAGADDARQGAGIGRRRRHRERPQHSVEAHRPGHRFRTRPGHRRRDDPARDRPSQFVNAVPTRGRPAPQRVSVMSK